MELKRQILDILSKSKYSYSDLANYLEISEFKLDQALENKTLDIRTLEIISKELRIPLYSFFHEDQMNFSKDYLKKYYNNSLTKKISDLTDLEKLQIEIDFLKDLLKQKEESLKILLDK